MTPADEVIEQMRDDARVEINGYGAHRPFIRVEFIGMAIIEGKFCEPDNGEPLDPDKKYFVIRLGKVLEIGNV